MFGLMGKGKAGRSARQRGIALLMVLSFLAILASITADFQVSSTVHATLAYQARDSLQAEYNALSALRFRSLLLRQSSKLQALVSQMGQMLLGPGQPVPPFNQLLAMVPVECGLLSSLLIKKDRLSAMEADEDPAGQGFFHGDCLATSESEHGKIAINLLRNPTNSNATLITSLLLGLLSMPAMEIHFQQDDGNGTHAGSPLELVQAIADWVDSDHQQLENLGDEDRHYSYLKDPYKAKNAPMDTVDELRLVHGVSDAVFDALKEHVTVYVSNPSIEVGSAPMERILLWGLPACLADGVPPAMLVPFLSPIYTTLLLQKQLAGGLLPLTTQNLWAVIGEAGAAQLFDQAKFSRVFADGSNTTWYSLQAEGRVGNTTHRMRAVLQASEGLFYYIRME